MPAIIWNILPSSNTILIPVCYIRGTEASHCLYSYRFHPSDGSMMLLSIAGEANEVVNPAFSRFHPSLNVLYTCTEDIEENGQIICYQVSGDGKLTKIGQVDAGGTSTCYLTIDRDQKNLIAVNYWNSTLATVPISKETGNFIGEITSKYDPKGGKQMVAAGKKFGGVNHSNNDASTIEQRQADPHSHALVLDPYVGCMAFVPCLGKDLIREFFYDKVQGKIEHELNTLPSGLCTGMADGPRYLEFHPKYNTMYVVNELSSTVAVFSVNKDLIRAINTAATNGESLEKFKGLSTLTLIQSINTIPSAFPKKMNTCGRLCLHKSGRYVLVSNRGHQSIAILRVKEHGPTRGQLTTVAYHHTRGETPRHFKFDNSGQYLLVANQDTDNLSIFNFNQCSGEIKFTGNEYRVPSPNFVCCCPLLQEEDGLIPSEVSGISDSISEASEVSTDIKKQLEDNLTTALAEVERLRTQISILSTE
uniref:6-phosphogluconolactonase n=1 Tax=Chaetoceros debilis TaxID=122233 RepID=A0A6S8SNI5_9STRA